MVMCCMHKILLNVLNVLMRTFQWCSGKESNSNVGDTREAELIPGSGRSPRRGTAMHFSVLSWKIPRTEEPGGLQSVGSQRVRLND